MNFNLEFIASTLDRWGFGDLINKFKEMQVLGIKFTSLYAHTVRKLFYSLAVFFSETIRNTNILICIAATVSIAFLTTFWLLPIIYLFWIWVLDKDVCERGGRRVECLRSLKCWKLFKGYFPVNIYRDSDVVELDPNKNYLFCCFPHGLLATGVLVSFGTKYGGFNKLFPKHTPYLLTLKQNFFMPILRDFILAMGMCAVSADSIDYLMDDSEGGKVACIVVGGAAESFHCKPGQYRLVLKERKGFVKVALKNGSPLVPVFSFGETDIYDQVHNPQGSPLRWMQEWTKKVTGVAPIIPLGRRSVYNFLSVFPRRRPINVIVGRPICVKQVEHPTQEEVDSLHKVFIEKLTILFEKHKHKYVAYPETTNLVIC